METCPNRVPKVGVSVRKRCVRSVIHRIFEKARFQIVNRFGCKGSRPVLGLMILRFFGNTVVYRQPPRGSKAMVRSQLRRVTHV